MNRIITGPWRAPRNTSAHEAGGIHDDHTAQALGFAGGTIAGSIHMEQFTPLLLEHFGERWWREGGLSMYFKAATVDDEPVRCVLEPEDQDRVRLRMETKDGAVVMDGSGSLGVDADSEIQQRLESVRDPVDLRMLEDVVIGWQCTPHPVRIDESAIDERLRVITENLPPYTDASLFEGRVLPVAPLVHAFRVIEPAICPIRGAYVGLFGAIEIQYLAGPVVAGRDYLATGQVLKLSESPKTEIVWYEATLTDAVSGVEVARMIKMDRLMKEASPLWEAFG